jgi:hypothetical protein
LGKIRKMFGEEEEEVWDVREGGEGKKVVWGGGEGLGRRRRFGEEEVWGRWRWRRFGEEEVEEVWRRRRRFREKQAEEEEKQEEEKVCGRRSSPHFYHCTM